MKLSQGILIREGKLDFLPQKFPEKTVDLSKIDQYPGFAVYYYEDTDTIQLIYIPEVNPYGNLQVVISRKLIRILTY